MKTYTLPQDASLEEQFVFYFGKPKPRKQWWKNGFGLFVQAAICKRVPKAEDGLFHLGGINTGHWIVYRHHARGKQIASILSLYSSEEEFLADK